LEIAQTGEFSEEAITVNPSGTFETKSPWLIQTTLFLDTPSKIGEAIVVRVAFPYSL
jgi:hypothetical protein